LPTHTFEVIVRGRLSPALLAAFGEFKATHFDRGLTHLIGHLPDHEGLYRLFGLLRDLNIELVSANPVRKEPSVPDS
jgi:hypothetical protein